MATIKDIARLAGVCVGTVSRVINNKNWVDPKTRQRIQALIEETGYQPSARGRALALKRSSNVMLVVSNIADPYWSTLSYCIQRCCRAEGYGLLLGVSDYTAEGEAEYLKRCENGSVDGLILSPVPGNENRPYLQTLKRHRFPLVLVDDEFPGLKLNCVKYDDFVATSIAMDYLVQKGHRRIGFVGWQTEFRTVKDRLEGYFKSHRKHGLKINQNFVVTAPKQQTDWRIELLDSLWRLPETPTALLAENEVTASMCLSALLRSGKRVPEDVALIAVGDCLGDQLAPIPLTTISLHNPTAAERAVRILLRLIEEPEFRQEPPQTFVVEPSLVIRQSA